MGIWPPRNFAPWRLLLTLLCIPLFYMIFLTIIYNWMCSWIYFLYKKNLLCTIFHVHYNWVFVLLMGVGGGTFIYCVHKTPSFQHILLSLVLSSSYTMYYQFWYNYIYKYKIIYKGLFETNPWQRWCLIHCEVNTTLNSYRSGTVPSMKVLRLN